MYNDHRRSRVVWLAGILPSGNAQGHTSTPQATCIYVTYLPRGALLVALAPPLTWVFFRFVLLD